MSEPPVDPVQPETAETSGKATEAMSDWASLAEALSVKEPAPPGRK